jgi:RecA/RadA recombinase
MEKIRIRDPEHSGSATPVSSCADELLCGGLKAGTVYDMFGPVGAGKTQFCMQLAVSALLRGTEGTELALSLFFPFLHFKVSVQ